MFFFNIKFFLDVHAFLNVVAYSPLQFIMKTIFFTELLESFKIFTFLNVLGSNVADQRSYPVDVVSETHHADDFNEN